VIGGSRPRLLAVIGVGIVLIVIFVVFGSRIGIDTDTIPSPLIGQPAPDLVLPLLETEGEIDLAALDAEVIVLNFFASWCLQCRLEHPDLVSTNDIYRERGVTFIGINYQDTIGPASEFLDELGRGDQYIYVDDPGSRAAIELGVFGIPETFFIRDGMIVGKLIGETDALVLSETLESILAGEQAGARQVGEQQQRPGG
jgi:cytochrome c biogenesis protein CcmG/thiol:disulfide interchange protein DsbE